jgi:hypothetical protein
MTVIYFLDRFGEAISMEKRYFTSVSRLRSEHCYYTAELTTAVAIFVQINPTI